MSGARGSGVGAIVMVAILAIFLLLHEQRLARYVAALETLSKSHAGLLDRVETLTQEMREAREQILILNARPTAPNQGPDMSWRPAVRELQGQLRALEQLGCWKWGP